MKPIIITGAIVVTLALASYSIAIITEQMTKKLSKKVLLFLTIGIILDIAATIMMIIGSSNGPFTLHGWVGYSALAFMLVDTYLLWNVKFKFGLNSAVPSGTHLYSRFAYIWWVLAYITGSMLVMIK